MRMKRGAADFRGALFFEKRPTVRYGENIIGGIAVVATRRRAKRIGIRIKSDGVVHLTVPFWRATLAEGEEFLRSKWSWVLRAREKAMASPRPEFKEASAEELEALKQLLGELNSLWAERLGEGELEWKTRRMKTRWGVCNYAKRRITYSSMLAGKRRELVEYVVVHELTHLKAHDHGERFRALMDIRLPAWRELRRELNGTLRRH